ncbi:MAG: site-specific integrase [Methylovirgula sp.]
MPKLTKRLIDGLRPDPSGADLFVWDSELRGFAIRVKPSGSASYLIQYRTPQRKTRRYAFGKVGTLTPDEARTKARRLLVDVEEGNDPSAQRRESREALSIAELCDEYLKAARAGLVTTRFRKAKRPSTVMIDDGRVARHIVPLLGSIPAGSLSRPAVQRMADAIAAGKTAGTFKGKPRGVAVVKGGAGAAARTVELLGGIWAWAEKRGFVRGPSPTKGVDIQRGSPKDRTLDASELARLGAAIRLQEQLQPSAAAALRLIALTGLRREEACGLRWCEIDFTTHCLRLDMTKTGRSIRPIGKDALSLLSALPRGPSEWVFPNKNGSGSADLKKHIAALFDLAGLPDARSHDLRRTFASFVAEEGYSDATIAELLGHARRGVTERHYIRRPDSALVAAADRIAGRIASILDGAEAEVLPIIAATKGA